MLPNTEHEPQVEQRMMIEAVTAMLPDGPACGPPSVLLREGSSVTVLRGFDRASRATRDVLRERLEPYGVRLDELVPAPDFGATPAPRPKRTDLVIAAHRAVLAPALRCAHRWQVPLLAADESLDPGRPFPLIEAAQPAASLSTPVQITDIVTRSLRLDGPVTCSQLKGQPRLSDGVLLTPAAGSVALTLDASGPRPHTRSVTGPVTLALRHDTTGYLDDTAQLFARGHSHISTSVRPCRRIITHTGPETNGS